MSCTGVTPGLYVIWTSSQLKAAHVDHRDALDPSTRSRARDDLRRVLIHDQADRDAISSRLLGYRHQNGQDWADIIDFLTMYPEARRQVVRLLAEIAATRHE